jgi:uncharacterized repeat protein (TIGR01451 family)
VTLRRMQMGLVAGAALILAAGSSWAQPAPPVPLKFFLAPIVGLGASTTLVITVINPGSVTLSSVTFTDTFPPGLVVSTPNMVVSFCSPGSTLGAITATAGSNSVSLGSSMIPAGGDCTVLVNVTGTVAGVVNNTVQAIDAVAGPGPPATAVITVFAPPTIAKAFSPTVIQAGGTSTLTFTITAAQALANVSFTDTLPAGLVVATPNGVSTTCGSGTVTATAGSSTVSLTGLAFAAVGSCTISVNVTGTTAGSMVNSVQATDVNAGAGNTATATLNVVSPPAITKTFAASQIQVIGPGNPTALTFTISNPNSVSLTGIAFIDTLPTGLIVATPNGLTGSCGGGPITAVAGTNSISLSGATLAGGASCTFSANVSATSVGVFTNTTSTVTAMSGTIVGNAATATIEVNDLFFYWFFAESGGGGRP